MLTETLEVRLPLKFIKGIPMNASIGKLLNGNDITSGALL